MGGPVAGRRQDPARHGLEAARQALRTGEADGIRTALDELNSAYSAAGAALYQSAQAAAPEGQPGPGAAGEPAGSAPKDDVVEADYEIVDEKK